MNDMSVFGDGEIDKDFTIKKQLIFKIRKLASLDRLSLDLSLHQSGLNLHLIKYLEYCGISPREYVRDYLKHLQPFMIEEFKSQEFLGAVCVLDNLYRISVYIKIDTKKMEEVVVSFHENNKNGIAKRNSLITRYSEVYVIPDSITAVIEGTDNASIKLFITRGISTFPIVVSAKKYDDDGFIVRYNEIATAVLGICNNYLEDLYTSDLSLDINQIQLFTSLQQLTFTSYGNDKFSSVSLLIDSILIQKDNISRGIADSALCIYCQNLNLLDNDKRRFLEILEERYKVHADRIVPLLLERVKDNLGACLEEGGGMG